MWRRGSASSCISVLWIQRHSSRRRSARDRSAHRRPSFPWHVFRTQAAKNPIIWAIKKWLYGKVRQSNSRCSLAQHLSMVELEGILPGTGRQQLKWQFTPTKMREQHIIPLYIIYIPKVNESGVLRMRVINLFQPENGSAWDMHMVLQVTAHMHRMNTHMTPPVLRPSYISGLGRSCFIANLEKLVKLCEAPPGQMEMEIRSCWSQAAVSSSKISMFVIFTTLFFCQTTSVCLDHKKPDLETVKQLVVFACTAYQPPQHPSWLSKMYLRRPRNCPKLSIRRRLASKWPNSCMVC